LVALELVMGDGRNGAMFPIHVRLGGAVQILWIASRIDVGALEQGIVVVVAVSEGAGGIPDIAVEGDQGIIVIIILKMRPVCGSREIGGPGHSVGLMIRQPCNAAVLD